MRQTDAIIDAFGWMLLVFAALYFGVHALLALT
jgi:hypothetical protein